MPTSQQPLSARFSAALAHALPKLRARQPHCLIPAANRSLSFLYRPRVFSLVRTASSIKQAQQPPVIAKCEPHQAIWVVDLGAQPRQPQRSCRRVCKHARRV